MICDNTISAGFYFMLGKFLFDITLTVSVLLVVILFWVWVAWSTKPKKEKNT